MQDRLNRRSSLACILGLAAGLAQANEELDDLAKIRARGTLKVAVYNDNPPFSSGKSPDVVGLDVALAAALARQLGLKLVLLPFDAGERMNDDLRNMVWRGHYLGYGPADVMLQVPVDKYLIDDNRQVMIFAPYMRQVPVLLHDISKLPRVEGPGDLEGLALAAESGTGTATVLIGHNGRSLSSKVSLFPSGVQAAGAVLKGDVAAAYVLRSQAEAAVLQGGGTVRTAISPLPMAGLPPNGWPIGMAIKKNFKDLGQALEVSLNALRASGELLAIFKLHGLTLTAP